MAHFEQLWDTDLDVQLNSESTQLFTKARRKAAINAGHVEFADLTGCFIRQSSVTCSCNVSEYALLSSGVLAGSTDFVRLSTQPVEYIRTDSNGLVTRLAGKDDFPQRSISWKHDQDPGWRNSTTPVKTPTGYYMRADGGQVFLGLNERPSIGSSEAAELLIPYRARPMEMASTGDLPFSLSTASTAVRHDLRIYHQALVHFGAYRLLPLQGKIQEAQAQLQIFLSYVTRYRQDQRPKGSQMVTLARNYYRDAQRQGDGTGRTVPGWTWQSGG